MTFFFGGRIEGYIMCFGILKINIEGVAHSIFFPNFKTPSTSNDKRVQSCTVMAFNAIGNKHDIQVDR